MPNEKTWLHRLTQWLTGDSSRGAAAPFTSDAEVIDDVYEQAAYEAREYQQRVQKNNEILGAIAPFEERLDALQTLAETTPDSLRSTTYDGLRRTMDEELGLIVTELIRGELAIDDIPATFSRWSDLGISYARTIGDNGEVATIFAADGEVTTDRTALAEIGRRRSDDALAKLNGAVADLQADLEAGAASIHDDSAQAAKNANDAEAALRMRREYSVERAVRDAYDMRMTLAAEAGDSDKRWLNLAELRTEIDDQARQRGAEPFSRDEVDAALQRLTHDTATSVHVIPEDHEHLIRQADRDTAVRFGDAERHMICIEDSDRAEPTLSHENTKDGSSRTAAEDSASAGDYDPDEPGWKSAEEQFEDWMDHEAALASGDYGNDEDSDDDPVPVEFRGKGWLGEPLTEDDIATYWRHKEQGRDAVENAAGAVTAQREPDRETAVAAETADDGEISAAVETSACTVAVTRASATVDGAAHAVDDAATTAVELQQSEDLAQWHDTDRAEQQANNRAMENDTTTVDDHSQAW